MRKSKNKEAEGHKKHWEKPQTISPSPMVFGKKEPVDLKRQESTLAQQDGLEEILLYGPDNAFPLRLAQAVDESPAASSCIDTISKFIKGSGFSNPDLQKLVVSDDGTTLWDLHCMLADTIAAFWGFAVNFKFNRKARIISAHLMPFESCRFKAPGENSPYINQIFYNPYYGTAEFKQEYTKKYDVFDIKRATEMMSKPKNELDMWPGQIYYWGKTSPLSRFYPKPKYWSAKEAIQADHKLQEFHNQELENGFFQSVLINAIGNPNEWSKNPRLQVEKEKTDGTKYREGSKTVGEEFNDQMSTAFSGSAKAGTAMVLWSLNESTAIKVAPFPTGINGDRIIATQDSITKTITIATGVPSILANISEGVSLGSGGSEIQKAVELMQSRTLEWREALQNFYNNVLLPNMEKAPKETVEIQNYNPVSEPVEIDDKIWEFLNEQERIAFIKKNMPEIEIIRAVQPATQALPAPQLDPESGEPLPAQPAPPKPNESLKTLKVSEIDRIAKIVARFASGKLTLEQAKQFLLSYGLTEEEINAWLVTPEEL